MKRSWMICVLVAVLALGGCGSEAMLVGGGAAAGVAGKSAVDTMQQQLAEQKATAVTDYKRAIADLQTATTDTERQTAQLRADTAARKYDAATVVDDSLKKTNDTVWTDPRSVGETLGGIGLAAFIYYLKRKKDGLADVLEVTQNALTQTVSGIQTFAENATPSQVAPVTALKVELAKSQDVASKELIKQVKTTL